MIIALDYDGTITSDPGFWKCFIAMAHLRPNQVIIVSSRKNTPEQAVLISETLGDYRHSIYSVYLTSGEAKKKYLEKRGIKVDIWIDDAPESIIHCKEEW